MLFSGQLELCFLFIRKNKKIKNSQLPIKRLTVFRTLNCSLSKWNSKTSDMKHQWPCGCMAKWGRPTGRSGTAPHAAAFSPAWADDTNTTAPLWSPVVLLPPRKQGVKPIRNTCYPLAPDVPMRGRDLRTPRRYVSWGCGHVAPCRWSNIPETFFHQKQWVGEGWGITRSPEKHCPKAVGFKMQVKLTVYQSGTYYDARHFTFSHYVQSSLVNHTVSCSAQVLKIYI